MEKLLLGYHILMVIHFIKKITTLFTITCSGGQLLRTSIFASGIAVNLLTLIICGRLFYVLCNAKWNIMKNFKELCIFLVFADNLFNVPNRFNVTL